MLAARLLIAAACLSFTGGCAATTGRDRGEAAPTAEAAPSGLVIRLAIGQPAEVAEAGLTFALAAIESDSRCPKGETCVWEGSATVRLTVTGSTGAQDLVLHTSSRSGPDSAIHDGWTVMLAAVDPYPVAGRAIGQADYVVTLRLTQGDTTAATR